MRLLLALFLAFCISNADNQKVIISTHYDIDKLVNKLAKPFDLEKTIRTIIRIESDDGKYLINLQSKDCGITGIHVKTFMKRHNIVNTPFNQNKACQDLVNNPHLAIANSIEELLYWKEIHCKGKCTKAQYRNVVKSYNAGWNYKGNQAKEYWNKFVKAYNELYN